ncbi:MAG: FAD-dependent oxidoreductase, partial [Alphaproteobacteria bacterium]|nr:FAD-dependent oxidoreductase [Alphaproteobacteria bacterium]
VIKAIEPNDSIERFEGMGVTVIQGFGRFVGPKEIEVVAEGDADPTHISARRFVIATGSRPFVPPIPGLDGVDYHTNETIFQGPILPDHLIVIGGGPIGIEMAQAHRHLGVRVTVLEMFSIMPKDDPELVAVVRRRLDEDGIDIIEGAAITGVEKTGTGIAVSLKDGDIARTIEGSHLLVATGRRANVDGVGLDAAGINASPQGIDVDARLRTSNKRVFAIGDVAGGLQFTHVAGYHAGVVIKNALFRWPAKADHRAVPWVTYTAPELAQVGLTEAEAKREHGDIRVLRWPYHENDRAQAEADTDGMVKAVVTPKGRILGCGIAGSHAGELIQTWVLAMSQNLKIGAVAQMIAPYPTLGEVSKRAAGSFYTPSIFSERTRKIVGFLRRFG